MQQGGQLAVLKKLKVRVCGGEIFWNFYEYSIVSFVTSIQIWESCVPIFRTTDEHGIRKLLLSLEFIGPLFGSRHKYLSMLGTLILLKLSEEIKATTIPAIDQESDLRLSPSLTTQEQNTGTHIVRSTGLIPVTFLASDKTYQPIRTIFRLAHTYRPSYILSISCWIAFLC